jgi:hypothetical protein
MPHFEIQIGCGRWFFIGKYIPLVMPEAEEAFLLEQALVGGVKADIVLIGPRSREGGTYCTEALAHTAEVVNEKLDFDFFEFFLGHR